MPSTPNILIVDDDERICRLLGRLLTREGYQVDSAQTAAAAREQVERARPSLVILDLRLPDADGLTLAREFSADSPIGIIMLTGRADVIDKVVGLEVGADDYITKPFEERELLARVRSVLRRTITGQSAAGGQEVLRFANWCLDLDAHELRDESGERVHLTTYEFTVLSTMAGRPSRVFSRDDILDLVSNRSWTPYDRSVDVIIGKLRKKIETDPAAPKIITTIRGAGYKFTTKVHHG